MARPLSPRGVPAPKPDPARAVESETRKDPEKEIDARLSLPLDKDGRVRLDSMRESSKDKLKGLLADTALAKSLGLSSSAAGPGLTPDLMYPLVAGLSIIETLIVGKATGAPREIVNRVVPYSREEADLLAPALAKVLDKYAGAFLGKYQEEAALAGLLISITFLKVSLVREETAKSSGPRGIVVPITGEPAAPAPAPDAPNA